MFCVSLSFAQSTKAEAEQSSEVIPIPDSASECKETVRIVTPALVIIDELPWPLFGMCIWLVANSVFTSRSWGFLSTSYRGGSPPSLSCHSVSVCLTCGSLLSSVHVSVVPGCLLTQTAQSFPWFPSVLRELHAFWFGWLSWSCLLSAVCHDLVLKTPFLRVLEYSLSWGWFCPDTNICFSILT